jgi:arylsulfatase A-like enzyme
MPTRQGFDEYEGIPYSNDMWPQKKKHPPLPYIKGERVVAHIPDRLSQAVLTDAITNAAVDFIDRNRNERFFAYVPFSAVHNPKCVLKERGDKAVALGLEKPDLAAQVMEIDNCVGRVMEVLRKHKIAEDTLVFFTNDNGGGAGGHKEGMVPLRGGKFGPKYEGHMRMATLAWWPGKIPAGSVCDKIGAPIDIMPTFARLAGAEVPTDRVIDGSDISDILLGRAGAKSPHELLYYEFDGIRQGKWKMVAHNRRTVDAKGKKRKQRIHELYDLDRDLGERNDLSRQYPEKVERLSKALEAHAAKVRSGIRRAGKESNPKVILPDAKGVPTLAEYLGIKGKDVF